MPPRLILDARLCRAAIFDMDGVVTDTARVHARAWAQMFDEFLGRRAARRGEPFRPFDPEADYRRHVDGKARTDGVRSFLAARGIDLAAGAPGDPPERDTVHGLGSRKNQLFLERLRAEGAVRFADAVSLVGRLRRAGIRTAVISASRNAREVLERAGAAELFEVRVDGAVAAERGLAGKPAPDVFLEAARRLDAGPPQSAVLEDAIAGVAAGRAGGFGWVIGVARAGGADSLREAGADVVVSDLSQIGVRGRPGADALRG